MQAEGDQERLKRQQELTALNLYQLQQLQYQYLLRYTTLTSNPTLFAVAARLLLFHSDNNKYTHLKLLHFLDLIQE